MIFFAEILFSKIPSPHSILHLIGLILVESLERRKFLCTLMMPVMSQYVSDLDKGKGMYFLFIKSEAKTPGGLVASTVSTSYSKKSASLKNKPSDPYANHTSPIQTILCPETFQSMYYQLLCGLCLNKDVIRVGAVCASGFIRAIQFLEMRWQLLCNDIRTGTLNPQIIDSSVRDAVMRILKPDPQLAEFIESQCGKKESSRQGIITRLWPNTKYIDVIVTGTMSQYIPTLDYYSNGLPLVCSIYASSECFFGINLNPLSKPSEVSYTLIPTLGYLEFIPVDRNTDVKNSITNAPESLDDKEQHELVDLVDVKLGQDYELVVTTYAGLYPPKQQFPMWKLGKKNAENLSNQQNSVVSNLRGYAEVLPGILLLCTLDARIELACQLKIFFKKPSIKINIKIHILPSKKVNYWNRSLKKYQSRIDLNFVKALSNSQCNDRSKMDIIHKRENVAAKCSDQH
ncbi:OLC1v1015896C1 [Oldenlandia corymbosa var. corymbosa]|uniref:OLC1v1015896C1 n=1 Tax=Oldenlandia corymbosa var. corymbosa TaxID=529605 RepID=A0AAV1E4S8_OLDCO|nr:OLC1v1015896C1 [Oldenlandia corymbosa var. corymbosa]